MSDRTTALQRAALRTAGPFLLLSGLVWGVLLFNQVVSAAGSISVTVNKWVGATAPPEITATVHFVDANGFNLPTSTGPQYTPTGGALTLGGLEAGSYLLRAFPQEGNSFAASPIFTVNVTDAATSTVTLILTRTVISGWVWMSEGITVPSAQVKLMPAGSNQVLQSIRGGPNLARYKIGGTGVGTFTVQAFAPSSGPYMDLGPSPVATVAVSNTSSTVLWQTHLTLTTPSITGTVVLSDSTPVTSTSVNLWNKSRSVNLSVNTNNAGRFAFSGLSPGDYFIRARTPNRSGFESVADSLQRPFTYEGGGALGLSPPLTLTDLLIQGTVFNPSGGAQTSTSVRIARADGSVEEFFGTNNQAFFRAGGFAPGAYLATALPPGNSVFLESAPRAITLAQGTVLSVGLTLTRASLTGTVTLPDEVTPVQGASVQIDAVSGTLRMFAGTRPNGEYRFGALPAGQYNVQARPPAALADQLAPSRVVSAEVASGETRTRNLRLTRASITGTVRLPDGGPAASAGVRAVKLDGSSDSPDDEESAIEDGGGGGSSGENTKNTGTNAQGVFAFGRLDSGHWRLDVFPPLGASGLIQPPSATVAITSENLTVNSGVFTLSRATKHIVGQVNVAGGGNVQGAWVFGNRQDGSGHADSFITGTAPLTYAMNVGVGLWNVGLGRDTRPGAAPPNWILNRPPTPVRFDPPAGTEVTATVDFTVTPANALVWGRVRKPNGSSSFEERSAFVNLFNQTGVGNSTPVQSNGYFTMPMPAGTFSLRLFTPSDDYSLPPQAPVILAETQQLDLGTIQLVEESSRIRGRVRDQEDNGVAGIDVIAFRRDAEGFARTTTITDGVFGLLVLSGTWNVRPDLRPDSGYSFAGPAPEVRLTDDDEEEVNLRVTATDATLNGSVVLSGTTTPVSGLYGYAQARRAGSGTSSGGDDAPTLGGPIANGIFAFGVPSGTYTVTAGFPQGTAYSLVAGQRVTATTGGTTLVTLTVRSPNAAITGTLRNSEGQAVTGLEARVGARADDGTHQGTEVDRAMGRYTMSVSAGTYAMGTHVEDEDGYVVRPRFANTVTVSSGVTQTYDFTVVRLGATLVGTVTVGGSTPVTGARVFANEIVNLSTAPRLQLSERTDSQGVFSLTMPGGTFRIGANVPPERGLVAPQPFTVTLGVTESRAITLAFGAVNSFITGNVTLDGTPITGTALVRAYSGDGGRAFVNTGSPSYSLPVKSGTSWILQAVYEVGQSLYRSSLLTVPVTTTLVTGQNLALGAAETMPQGQSATFDASQAQTITLSDGTEIRVPAGALAVSGTVSIIATPRGGVPTEAAQRPLGLAYSLVALDSDGQNITQFNSSVEVVLRYTDAQLAALGITASDLVPSFFDEASQTWRPSDNVVVDTTNHTFTLLTLHFTDFGLLGTVGSVSSTSYRLYLPLVVKSYAGGW